MQQSGKALHRTEDSLKDLVELMRRLRDPDNGCPWDLEQDFSSIAPYTIEEAYEVLDAIERNAFGDLKEELGDLLLQVVFHSQMAEDAGLFDFQDVAEGIVEKMVRRHPHVFSDADIATSDAQTAAWEEVKAAERASKASQGDEANDTLPSALDGVASALPALTRAEKLLKRAARTGFEWQYASQLSAKVKEELDEVELAVQAGDRDSIEDEVGDLLIAATNLARFHGIDPEAALRRANNKFERRFKTMERTAQSRGSDFSSQSLDEMLELWKHAKRNT